VPTRELLLVAPPLAPPPWQAAAAHAVPDPPKLRADLALTEKKMWAGGWPMVEGQALRRSMQEVGGGSVRE